MRQRPGGAWLAAALLATGGCSYLHRRAVDFGDCFLYRWYDDALGIGAVAKVGPLEAAIGGWYANGGVGKDTWWQQPGEVLTNHGTGVPFTTIGPLAYGQSWSREVGIAPLFWNAHVGFNVAEFADFLLGFVGIDLLGDDDWPRPPSLPYVPAGGEQDG
jgi:hypothetical protein